MENIQLEFKSSAELLSRAVHVGVVASGDLEVMFEPISEKKILFDVKTTSDGKKAIWTSLVQRIVEVQSFPSCRVLINDFSASPGVIEIRLEQALSKWKEQ